MKRRPLRVKLTVLMVLLLSLGLFVSSLIATTALRGYLLDRIDEQMIADIVDRSIEPCKKALADAGHPHRQHVEQDADGAELGERDAATVVRSRARGSSGAPRRRGPTC